MAMDAYGNYLPQPGDPTQLGGTGQLLVGQIPAGGTAGQALLKGSNADFVLAWGAAGGATLQQVYIGRDPAPPDDPTKPAISFPSGGGTTTQWDVLSQTWV